MNGKSDLIVTPYARTKSNRSDARTLMSFAAGATAVGVMQGGLAVQFAQKAMATSSSSAFSTEAAHIMDAPSLKAAGLGVGAVLLLAAAGVALHHAVQTLRGSSKLTINH